MHGVPLDRDAGTERPPAGHAVNLSVVCVGQTSHADADLCNSHTTVWSCRSPLVLRKSD